MRDLEIRFIRGLREAMNKKRKFDGVGDQSSHGGDPGRGTVPDFAADVVDVVAAETVRTAEAEVGVGEMVQPRTPPTKTDRKIETFRTDRTEVGWRRKKT